MENVIKNKYEKEINEFNDFIKRSLKEMDDVINIEKHKDIEDIRKNFGSTYRGVKNKCVLSSIIESIVRRNEFSIYESAVCCDNGSMFVNNVESAKKFVSFNEYTKFGFRNENAISWINETKKILEIYPLLYHYINPYVQELLLVDYPELFPLMKNKSLKNKLHAIKYEMIKYNGLYLLEQYACELYEEVSCDETIMRELFENTINVEVLKRCKIKFNNTPHKNIFIKLNNMLYSICETNK